MCRRVELLRVSAEEAEREVSCLRERVRAELEAARSLAADAATDRAALSARDKEVGRAQGAGAGCNAWPQLTSERPGRSAGMTQCAEQCDVV